MPEQPRTAEQQKFLDLIGRVVSDEKFAKDLERNPEKTLRSAGVELNDEQRKALRDSTTLENFSAATILPTVHVLTQPAVSVAVQVVVHTIISKPPTNISDPTNDEQE